MSRNTEHRPFGGRPIGGAVEGGASAFFVSAHLFFYIMNIYGYSLYIPYIFHIYIYPKYFPYIYIYLCIYIYVYMVDKASERSFFHE